MFILTRKAVYALPRFDRPFFKFVFIFVCMSSSQCVTMAVCYMYVNLVSYALFYFIRLVFHSFCCYWYLVCKRELVT
jgi:hypothetical protein